MFTVKLVRQNTITLVEAETVRIYPAGKPGTQREEQQCSYQHEGRYWKCVLDEGHEGEHKATGRPEQPCVSTNRVRGISITLFGKMQVFHVGDDPSQIAGDVDLYDCAFIENSEGATTERVYAK